MMIVNLISFVLRMITEETCATRRERAKIPGPAFNFVGNQYSLPMHSQGRRLSHTLTCLLMFGTLHRR